MADHEKVNLKDDLDDMAVKAGQSPNIEFRMAGPALGGERSSISYLRLAPDFRRPGGHTHKEQEEIYLLVSGTARIKLDDEVQYLRPWDAVRMSPDTMRALEAGPEGAELILIGAPKTDPADAEIVRDWWKD